MPNTDTTPCYFRLSAVPEDHSILLRLVDGRLVGDVIRDGDVVGVLTAPADTPVLVY